MTLREKRCLFTHCVANAVLFAESQGYEVAFDEVKRGQAQAAANAAAGVGIKNSVHLLGLAADLLLYKDGVYLKDSADYKLLGEYWKQQNTFCCWGGDFAKQDGNHFSFSHEGYK